MGFDQYREPPGEPAEDALRVRRQAPAPNRPMRARQRCRPGAALGHWSPAHRALRPRRQGWSATSDARQGRAILVTHEGRGPTAWVSSPTGQIGIRAILEARGRGTQPEGSADRLLAPSPRPPAPGIPRRPAARAARGRAASRAPAHPPSQVRRFGNRVNSSSGSSKPSSGTTSRPSFCSRVIRSTPCCPSTTRSAASPWSPPRTLPARRSCCSPVEWILRCTTGTGRKSSATTCASPTCARRATPTRATSCSQSPRAAASRSRRSRRRPPRVTHGAAAITRDLRPLSRYPATLLAWPRRDPTLSPATLAAVRRAAHHLRSS